MASQQDFLREAMQQLGMTRDQFCKRISVPRKTFDKWLAPEGSKEFRAMPEMAWSYIRDILNNFGK
ncbi:aspartate carbamoyltransferase [compost metagenome]